MCRATGAAAGQHQGDDRPFRGLANGRLFFLRVYRANSNECCCGKEYGDDRTHSVIVSIMDAMKATRILLGIVALCCGAALVADEVGNNGRGVLLRINDAIGPATADYFNRGLADAAERGASVVVLQLDTPGGLDTAMRDMIQGTLASPIPVIIWVAPNGARAASAGTYLLYASHVAAMAPATNLGAATPVSIAGGTPAPEQEPENDDAGVDETERSGAGDAPRDASSMKAVNDAVAYIRGLAELRGRNAEWAERAVREAASLNAREALEQGVIDIVAADLDELLAAVDGMTVTTPGGDVVLATAGMQLDEVEPDWRNRLLATITNPSIAYLLLLIGLYGLLLEGYNPGSVVPGVVGAISLLMAAYALQLLPVNYVGLALILLGVMLIVAETFVPSFGALGLGGIIALVIGSVMLLDTDVPGFGVPAALIGAVAFVAGAVLLAILMMLMRTRRNPVSTGAEGMIGAPAVAAGDFSADGHVRVHGELWNATSTTPVQDGQHLRVTAIDGLHLTVSPDPERE